jgi:hypothetical protein
MLLFLRLSLATALATPADTALQALTPDGTATLQPISIRWGGGHIIRVEQSVAGLPVHGRSPVVMVGVHGEIRHLSGALLDHRPPRLTPVVTASDAKAIAETALFSRDLMWPSRATLVVFVDSTSPRLAWSIDVGHAWPVAMWNIHVDAIDGTVLDTVPAFSSATGLVFPESPAFSGPETVELQRLWPGLSVDGEYAFSRSCVDWYIDPKPFGRRDCLALEATAKADVQGNFTDPPRYGDTLDPFTEVNAYHHTDRVSAWANEQYGIRLDAPISVITNFPLTNAFYGDFDGDGFRDISFGISDDGLNLGYDSDIVFHEFGHAIVRTVAGSMYMSADALGLDFTPGSLNEGAADVISMVLNGDPLLGEYMGQSSRWDRAIRDLGPDRLCPDDLQSEVHRDGEIWGALAWNMIEDPDIGSELVADLLIGTLARFDQTAGWPGAGTALLEAAADLRAAGAINDDTFAAIEDHIDAFGILDCSRIVELHRDLVSRHYLMNLGFADPFDRMPIGVQFAIPTPPNAHTVVFRVSDFTGEESGTGWTVHVRSGAPIEHEASKVEGLGLAHAAPIEFDSQFDGEVDGTIVLDAHSSPPLVAGETYYFAVSSQNLTRTPLDVAYSRIALSAEVHIHEAGSPIVSSTKGCRCSHGGAPWSGLLWCLVAMEDR